MDGKTELQMQSFESPKIRLLRSLSVEGSDGMQVFSYAYKHKISQAPTYLSNNSVKILVTSCLSTPEVDL